MDINYAKYSMSLKILVVYHDVIATLGFPCTVDMIQVYDRNLIFDLG